MGIAEVIPGVSGGTIAFITGIYEQLLNTIKAFSPALFTVFKEKGVTGVWDKINGPFLMTLLIGMACGVLVGIFGISFFLENYPILVWAFFFGLIIASAIYVGRQLTHWGATEIGLLILGAIVAYGITIITPAEGSTSLFFVFFSGAIAISALILPGISGSFILLLMGMYTIIIPTMKKALTTLDPDSLLFALVFALGCLTGLMTFSRVLSWTFDNFRNQTLAILTGFMVGSLNKIWPWRIPDLTIDTGEKIKVITEHNVLPGNFPTEPYLVGAIILMVVGFLAVFAIEKLGSSNKGQA